MLVDVLLLERIPLTESASIGFQSHVPFADGKRRWIGTIRCVSFLANVPHTTELDAVVERILGL
jgi:hypothetical protein